MAGLNVHHLEPREESADERNGLVGHVLALGAADKQGGLLEPGLLGVLEGEVAHVVELLGNDAERHLELLLRRTLGPVQVAQEELAHRQVLFVLGQDLVGLALLGHARGVDALHALDVLAKVAAELGVEGRVVDADNVAHHGGFRERHRHGRLGPHAVTDEGGLRETLGPHKGHHVVGHGGVVVLRVVRRVAVVAQVHGVDVPAQLARQHLGYRPVVLAAAKQPVHEDDGRRGDRALFPACFGGVVVKGEIDGALGRVVEAGGPGRRRDRGRPRELAQGLERLEGPGGCHCSRRVSKFCWIKQNDVERDK